MNREQPASPNPSQKMAEYIARAANGCWVTDAQMNEMRRHFDQQNKLRDSNLYRQMNWVHRYG